MAREGEHASSAGTNCAEGPATRLQAAIAAHQHTPLTRLQARRAAKRPGLDDSSCAGNSRRVRARRVKQQQQQEQQEEQHLPPPPQQQQQGALHEPVAGIPVSIVQSVRAVIAAPASSGAHQHLPQLLQVLAEEQATSRLHQATFHAVIAVAHAAPGALLHVLLAHTKGMQHLLELIHTEGVAAHGASLTIAAVARQAAIAGPQAALALSNALLVQQEQGLQHLLHGVRSASHVVAHAISSAIGSLSTPSQLNPGAPAAAAVVSLWSKALLGDGEQQQGHLQLLLEALEVDTTKEPAALTLLNLAVGAHERLLSVLLSSQQRRGLHRLVRALDSSRNVSIMASKTLEHLARSSTGQQLQVLLQNVLRAVQHRSVAAAKLLEVLSTLTDAQWHLVQHVQQLLQMLKDRQQVFRLAAANTLWQVLHTPEPIAAGAAVGVLSQYKGVALLLDVVLQRQGSSSSSDDDWMEVNFKVTCACTVGLLSRTTVGQHVLAPFICKLLQVVTQQHQHVGVTGPLVRALLAVATGTNATVAQAGLQQLLAHTEPLLEVMLLQEHPEAAMDAGNTLLVMMQSAEGMRRAGAQHNVATLLKVVAQRGPATPHAARAIAHITAAVPSSRALLAAPEQQCGVFQVMEQQLLPIVARLAAHAAPPEACEAFGPVFWMTVAAATAQTVPCYVPKLVEMIGLLPHFAMPIFDALSYLVTFRKGLLALAPHVQLVESTVRQRIVDGDQFIHDAEALQTCLKHMAARVAEAVAAVRLEQQLAEGRMQHAALQLAHAFGRYRRSPCTTKLQAAVMMWLQQFGRLSEVNGELLQMLQPVMGMYPAAEGSR